MHQTAIKHVSRIVYTFEDILDKQGYLVYTCVGSSMLPLLREKRDLIEIRAKDINIRCKRYDVVLFKCADKYLLHRVLKVRSNDYIICGDHNIWCEKGVTDRQIIGVMTRIIRDGKDVTPNKILYKCYVHLWCDFFHLRVAILYSLMLFRSVGHRLKILLGLRQEERK